MAGQGELVLQLDPGRSLLDGLVQVGRVCALDLRSQQDGRERLTGSEPVAWFVAGGAQHGDERPVRP